MVHTFFRLKSTDQLTQIVDSKYVREDGAGEVPARNRGVQRARRACRVQIDRGV